jgi:hypothetical protein
MDADQVKGHMRHAIIFFALAACGNSAPASPPPPLAPSPPPSASSASAAADPAPDKKKRTRTGKAVPTTHDGTKPKNGRPLNPKDASGRTVFVREDDHCFVEIPDSTEVIDCPAAANDPAFDHCTAQVVLDGSGDKCFCVSGAGNPRPMPRPTPCPAQR